MNIAEMLGTPVDDPTDVTTPHQSTCMPPAPRESSSPPQRQRSRVLTTGLVVAALAIGAGAGWYASSTGSEAPPSAIVSPAAPVQAQIGEFAEMFTALYLSGTASAEDLGSMYIGTPPTGTGTWVNQSAALVTESLGDGFWEVTVAVDSLELVDGSYESAGIQYFELTVSEQEPYPVAVSAPSRTPAPAAASGVSIPSFTDAVPADQAAAVTHFMNGYLTGQEEIARYVTPTARIQLFAEPPYEAVSITSMGSDTLGYVRVDVAATTPRGATHMLAYTLELSFAAGVWEVSDLTSAVNGI